MTRPKEPRALVRALRILNLLAELRNSSTSRRRRCRRRRSQVFERSLRSSCAARCEAELPRYRAQRTCLALTNSSVVIPARPSAISRRFCAFVFVAYTVCGLSLFDHASSPGARCGELPLRDASAGSRFGTLEKPAVLAFSPFTVAAAASVSPLPLAIAVE